MFSYKKEWKNSAFMCGVLSITITMIYNWLVLLIIYTLFFYVKLYLEVKQQKQPNYVLLRRINQLRRLKNKSIKQQKEYLKLKEGKDMTMQIVFTLFAAFVFTSLYKYTSVIGGLNFYYFFPLLVFLTYYFGSWKSPFKLTESIEVMNNTYLITGIIMINFYAPLYLGNIKINILHYLLIAIIAYYIYSKVRRVIFYGSNNNGWKESTKETDSEHKR